MAIAPFDVTAYARDLHEFRRRSARGAPVLPAWDEITEYARHVAYVAAVKLARAYGWL